MFHKKKMLGYAAAVLLAVVLPCLITGTYVKTLDHMLQEENYNSLEQVAEQNAKAITEKLDGDMRMLRAMAILLGDQHEFEVTKWVELISQETLFDQFLRVGIILPNGQGYGQDVSGTNFSDREYFKQAMSGNYFVSDVLVDRTAKELSITFAVPIERDGAIVGVLAAVTSMETYQKILFSEPFMGKGYAYILNNDGSPVVYGSHPDGDIDVRTLSQLIQTGSGELKRMRERMLQGQPGRLEFSLEGQDRFLCYVPLELNDWYAISVVPAQVVRDKSRSIVGMTAIATGISCAIILMFVFALVRIQVLGKKKLERLAYSDELTELGNKNFFAREARLLLANAKERYVYCVLDIRRFKLINDRFGYSQGDNLLRYIGQVLKSRLGAGEVAAHLSADVFHLLLRFENREQLEHRLEELAQEIARFDFAAGHSFHIKARFGVYVVEQTDLPLETMGDLAKVALNEIRTRHGATSSFYSDDIQNYMLREQEIEDDMQRAVDNREFEPYVQPKYRLETGELAGGEVLVRWIHPEKGMLMPDSFIPLFEKNGFISVLDLYLFERLCVNIRKWIDDGVDIAPIAINQSRVDLYLPGYIEKLFALVRQYRIPPGQIVIEITESVFLNDGSLMMNIVERLGNAGFLISMDDFGSGYSSLNMLQEILLDELKIDRNFFHKITSSSRGQIIVRNIISMAKDLNLQIVAEGVETTDQVAFLKQTSCQIAQGYYFSRPLPMSEFEKLLYQDEAHQRDV